MANQLPCTITVNATATAVQFVGHHCEVEAYNLGTVPVYARADGTAAAVGADLNYCLPPAMGTFVDIETVPSGGSLASDAATPVTNLSLISTSGTSLVHFFECCCD